MLGVNGEIEIVYHFLNYLVRSVVRICLCEQLDQEVAVGYLFITLECAKLVHQFPHVFQCLQWLLISLQ